MKKTKIVFLISIFILAFVLPVYGQQRKAPAPVSVNKISEHVYEVRGGSGSNSAFIVGDREVYVIDAKMVDQSAKDMIAAIKKTTDKPVKHLLLTHSDGDHVNGMPGFPGDINIIAHENSAKDIIKANETGQVKIPTPSMTFSNQLNLYSGDLEINLFYFGHAHTDGNIVIYVPEDKVAIIGDLFFKGMDPLIHKHKNGSSEGFVNVLQKMVDLNAKTYLSGHAEPIKKDEIEGLRNTIMGKRNKVKAMVKDGKSLDDIKKAFGLPAGQSRWPSLVENIYGEMTQEK